MKKGLSLQSFTGMAVLFGVVAIILSMGGEILVGLQENQCASNSWNETTQQCDTTTTASNITGQGLTGANTMGSWLPTIAVVVAAAVIIGLIVNYFRG